MTSPRLRIQMPDDTSIVLTRAFHAPRRLVWRAFTEPAEMRRWLLPPPGWTMTVCVVEAQVGGALTLAWKSPDADPVMTLHGVFTEVVPHERMVHTETMVMGSGETVGTQLETHEFTEKGGVTTLRITQVYASKGARDGALASGMEHGLEAGYEQLDGLLARSA